MAWSIPKGATTGPADRQGWKPASKGVSADGGLALENKQIVLLVRPGAAELELYSKAGQAPATRVDLALIRPGGAAAVVSGAEVRGLAAGEATLRVATGDAEADLTVQRGQSLVTVRPVRGGGFLEVRAKARYAVMPGFSTQDVVCDPTRFQDDTLAAPAENFLLNFLDGHRAIVMCVWPGRLAETKEALSKTSATKPAGRDPVVNLLLEGQGSARRVAAARIELLQGPIYVAVLEHEHLWHERDASGLAPGRPTRIDWKRPFNAQWRANVLAAAEEERTSTAPLAPSPSHVFLSGPRPDYPAYFNRDDTYLALPAKARQDNQPHRVLIYASDRTEDTPVAIHTPVDIMRQTLSVGACAYVLDLADAKARGSAGGDGRNIADGDKTAPALALPPDTPEQARLRKELRGKGYIFLPRDNRLYRMDADGGNPVLLRQFGANESVSCCQASWDGKCVGAVVTLPQKSDRRGQELWLVNSDDGDARSVFHDPQVGNMSCAWSPDSAWVVIAHGLRADAVHRDTGQTRKLVELEKGRVAYLSSDRQGTFYFWGEQNVPPGDAFTIDKDCNLAKGLHSCGMVSICQPKISPDGRMMARHDHDYEWNQGRKRGYISERPGAGEKSSKRRYFFPTNENMPCRGTHDMPFWSPDGQYLGFVYSPDVELLAQAGFPAAKGAAVIAVCRVAGGPMVWLAPGGARFPSWGPAPTD